MNIPFLSSKTCLHPAFLAQTLLAALEMVNLLYDIYGILTISLRQPLLQFDRFRIEINFWLKKLKKIKISLALFLSLLYNNPCVKE